MKGLLLATTGLVLASAVTVVVLGLKADERDGEPFAEAKVAVRPPDPPKLAALPPPPPPVAMPVSEDTAATPPRTEFERARAEIDRALTVSSPVLAPMLTAQPSANPAPPPPPASATPASAAPEPVATAPPTAAVATDVPERTPPPPVRRPAGGAASSTTAASPPRRAPPKSDLTAINGLGPAQ